eukprot:UN10388
MVLGRPISRKKGPVNKPELIMMLEQEKISEQTLVWKAGMDDWVTLHEALLVEKWSNQWRPPQRTRMRKKMWKTSATAW